MLNYNIASVDVGDTASDVCLTKQEYGCLAQLVERRPYKA